MTQDRPSTGVVRCPSCEVALTRERLNRDAFSPCPTCGALLQVDTYPALDREIEEGKAGETLLVDDDASCFYHPAKKAVVACQGCGRFLCSLCDVELDGQHICPSCLEAGRFQEKPLSLQNKRILHEEIAMALAIFPALLIFPTIVTAPATLFYVIRYWNRDPGILPKRRFKMVLAFILASLQVAAWAMGIGTAMLY